MRAVAAPHTASARVRAPCAAPRPVAVARRRPAPPAVLRSSWWSKKASKRVVKFREDAHHDAAPSAELEAAGANSPSPPSAQAPKPRVVVLGSGWASMSLIKALPDSITKRYEVVVVSPRSYFLYTPLLPAVAVGTMEERSIIEPVRHLVHGKAAYYEASCTCIDPDAKQLTCAFPASPGLGGGSFTLSYDLLVLGVGASVNTFGVPGVAEHCTFLKSVEDAHALRRRVAECFERASLPGTSDTERSRLLSFVVCGGGPTGVEVAAELHDMIRQDLASLYPGLMPHVAVRVIEMCDSVLSSYAPAVGEFTRARFERAGIELLLGSRITRVDAGAVTFVDRGGEEQRVPFGSCVWATGIGMSPLVRAVQRLFPEAQSHSRCLLTDGYLRVLGSDGSILACGDASALHQPRAAAHADELFDAADGDKDGLVTLAELQALLREAAKRYKHLAGPARLLGARALPLSGQLTQLVLGCEDAAAAMAPLEGADRLSRTEFTELLARIDASLHALPATAQVAKQEGEFVAQLLVKGAFDREAGQLALPRRAQPFSYFHKGSLAYVGEDQAVMDVPVPGMPPVMGHEAGLAWRLYEVSAQFSLRTQMLVAADMLRSKLFGRDFSNV